MNRLHILWTEKENKNNTSGYLKRVAKAKGQIAIIIIGVISYGLGIKTMLQQPTMILTPWFLILLFSPFVFGASLLLAFFTKFILKSNWHLLTFTAAFVSVICLAFIFKYHRNYDIVKVQLDEHKSGHYFIISTSDKGKASMFDGTPISFDENNVIYLDSGLFNNCGIRPVNKTGKEISKRMKNYMGNEHWRRFYNPTDEEYKLYPYWNEYYHKYNANDDIRRLKKLGYIFRDANLKLNK